MVLYCSCAYICPRNYSHAFLHATLPSGISCDEVFADVSHLVQDDVFSWQALARKIRADIWSLGCHSFPQLHQLLILGRSRREKRGSGRAPGVEADALPRLAWPKIGCLPGGSGGRLQHPSVEPKPSAIFSPSLLLIPRCILVQAGDKVCKAPTGMQEVWKSRAGQWRGIRAPLLR